MSGLTVQAILQATYPIFERSHKVALHVRRAMGRLLRCGTGELGTFERRCPDGHFSQIEGRSCRHRACPRCAWRRGVLWLEGWKARLLPGTHFQVVFTLPSELHPLWRANRKLMAELLFQAAWDTLRTLLGDPRWLGALPGVLMALHTWSRSLVLHPHVHCLVTGGGITAGGEWKPVSRNYLVNLSVLRTVFRGKMLSAVEQAEKDGHLELPPGWTARTAAQARRQASRRKWNVRIEAPYRHGQGLVIYLARYLCGGPIGDRRIVAFDGQSVTFVTGREPVNPGTMTVTAEEFVRRIAEHVPVPGLRVVRAYGLYASASRRRLTQVRAQLAAAPSVSSCPPENADQHTYQAAEPQTCPVCGKRLVLIETGPRHRRPKPSAPSLREPLRRVELLSAAA